MEREYSYACGQKASPEDGGAVEGGSLLNGKQQASYRCCKRRRHTFTSHMLNQPCMPCTSWQDLAQFA